MRALGTALVVGPLLGLVRIVDPAVPGRYPSCPVRALLGVDCPGCGTLRALHELTHGDLLRALDHNLLLVTVLPVVAFELGRWVGHRPPATWTARRYAPAVVGATVALWFVLRNLPIPGLEFLGSAAT